MKLPKRESYTMAITLCGIDYTKDVKQYICYKDVRDYPKVTIKIINSREFRQAKRDTKAFYRVLKRLVRHGWKPKENERADNERDFV